MHATCYRIYTEDKPNLAALTGVYFSGFTIYSAAGIWKGASEPAAVIEILSEDDGPEDGPHVLDLARRIKRENNQQAVIVTSEPVTMTTV